MKKLNLLLLTMSLSMSAFPGTESGGGGGVIWVAEDQPVMMDSFTIVRSLKEIPFLAEEASTISEGQGPVIINDLTETQVRENPAFAGAMEILNKWQALPFDMMSGFVLGSMKEPLSWNFSEATLVAPPFYLAANLPEGRTEVVAYYTNSTVSINRKIWNKFNLFDQEALLIHETLRQVQIGYKQNYNDESLQRATAIYTLCKPSGRLNYYMYYLLNNSPKSADKIYGPFTDFIDSSCKRL